MNKLYGVEKAVLYSYVADNMAAKILQVRQ